jgi:hypothetical protein
MKNCLNCQLVKVCKFADKMDKFENEMYDMFEYPEWNEIAKRLKMIDLKCKYFKQTDDKL